MVSAASTASKPTVRVSTTSDELKSSVASRASSSASSTSSERVASATSSTASKHVVSLASSASKPELTPGAAAAAAAAGVHISGGGGASVAAVATASAVSSGVVVINFEVSVVATGLHQPEHTSVDAMVMWCWLSLFLFKHMRVPVAFLEVADEWTRQVV